MARKWQGINKKAVSGKFVKAKLPSKIRKLSNFGRNSLTKCQEGVLDSIWSRAVKARAGNHCERCSKSEPLNSHHVIGRRNKTLRHVVSNGCCLCVGCHFYAEQNGVAFAQWILEKRGDQWWSSLQVMARQVKVFKEFTVVKAYLESFL